MNQWRLIETAWTLAIVVVLVLIAYALTGCAPAECVRPIVQIERPVLPEVAAGELESISVDAYGRLLLRDRMLHEYAEELEVIVRELAEVPE